MSETGERRKSKENGESSSKKKPKPRQKITIKDFALGESSQPSNLVDDVAVQGPKITWPQLLHLAPKVRRQWTKMVSTQRVKTKAMGLVFGRNLQDITPMLNAYVKGQRVSNVYVDGGAQICVMTEQTMQHFGLKINAPAPCKAKMANNSKVKCLGVINGLKIKVCEIEVEVDVYVMPTKGEGYPIILGRPWLMAMQEREDWGTGMLELQPHKGANKDFCRFTKFCKMSKNDGISGFVRDKLDKNNLHAWKFRMTNFLMGKGYWNYIDGNQEEMPELSNVNPTTEQINAFKDWNQGARKVMYWLSISVQDTMIGHIQDATSPKQAWDMLVSFDTTNTKARKIQLKNELNTVKKENLSINDYTLKIKGASNHLINHAEWFKELQALQNLGYVKVGDDTAHPIARTRNVPLSLQDGNVKYLADVLHVPNITKNLVSVGRMVEQGLQVRFNAYDLYVEEYKKNGKLIAQGKKVGRMFILDVNIPEVNAVMFAHGSSVVADIEIWHKRIGHANVQRLKTMQTQELVTGLPVFKVVDMQKVCEAC
ncbi:hypothetical protein L7F22_012974 [Adiantum nelumboides]|nr:hypothetical protein [Adiantum nelumboides]